MSLDIIIGSMFSGKTMEIIKYYNKYSSIYKTIVINHSSDNRYNEDNVISTHNNITIDAIKLSKLSELCEKTYEESQFILIDESQFFPDLNEFVLNALDDEKNILIVGLNGDCEFKPFMNIMNLIPYADTVKHLTSLCNKCKTPTKGFMHYRVDNENKEKYSVGGVSDYLVLCRRHYNENVTKKQN